MIIIAFLAILFAIFFIFKRHIGAALLASLAGFSIYEMYGQDMVSFFSHSVKSIPTSTIEAVFFLLLVLGFPLLLYFRSGHGGLFGILRIAEAAAFAFILTSFCAHHLSTFLNFDDLGNNILSFINSIKGTVLVGGIIAAYLDILFYHN